MSCEENSVTKAETAPSPEDERKPDSPDDIPASGWKYTARRVSTEFGRDHCTDLAASLTYYAVLALFPGLVALVSLLGVFGQGDSTTETLLDLVRQMGQGDVADTLQGPIDQMTQARGAGLGLVLGLVGALWSASGYIGAFGRALNRVYEIDEGRPMWKRRPQQLLLTFVIVVLAALVLVGLVVSGPVASAIGEALGIGDTAVLIWSIAKWPVMIFVVMVIVAMLYYFTPNVQQPKMRWMSPGAALAILTWVLASVAFGFYVANFGSYNKTYGSLAGVIVFLLWMWLTNLALLFGAELDAELERTRQLHGGIEAEETIQLPPRDTRQSEKQAEKVEAQVEQGRRIRERAEAENASEGSEDPSERASSEPGAGATEPVHETTKQRIARERSEPRKGLPGLIRRLRQRSGDQPSDD